MTEIEERAGLLAECLEEMNTSLVELTAIFRVKRQVLAQADMGALEELLAKEESVAQALFEAETRREVLAEEIAAATGSPRDRLADIAASVPGGAAEVLIEAGMRLRDTVSVLAREARIVADICRAATEHYDRLIRILTGAGEPATYTPSGPAAPAASRSIIDQAF
jgi:flagellar biosynthesis/type III secretory pathway chaperone